MEINNCDAEGRLVLAEGVAHATKHIKDLDLVVDMATLTGAQLVATGKKHAAVLCNKQALEERAVAAGLHSGDLCYPVLYEPQLMEEFKSEVADMKNSVKDRSNAQTSCAGHFIEAHLDESYQGGWLVSRKKSRVSSESSLPCKQVLTDYITLALRHGRARYKWSTRYRLWRWLDIEPVGCDWFLI